MLPSIKIAPSLAAAPLANLGALIREIDAAGADIVHFDVEDGHFVPVMTLGTRLIGELRPLTGLPFDVHLMVSNPEALIPELARLGADSISVHYEACPYPRRTLGMIKAAGKQAGLAFNPKTELPDLSYTAPLLDFILILTTEPETHGSPYLPAMLEKVRQARRFADASGRSIDVVVDGGIGAANIAEASAAGATVAVAGRGAFDGGRLFENIREMREALRDRAKHTGLVEQEA